MDDDEDASGPVQSGPELLRRGEERPPARPRAPEIQLVPAEGDDGRQPLRVERRSPEGSDPAGRGRRPASDRREAGDEGHGVIHLAADGRIRRRPRRNASHGPAMPGTGSMPERPVGRPDRRPRRRGKRQAVTATKEQSRGSAIPSRVAPHAARYPPPIRRDARAATSATRRSALRSRSVPKARPRWRARLDSDREEKAERRPDRLDVGNQLRPGDREEEEDEKRPDPEEALALALPEAPRAVSGTSRAAGRRSRSTAGSRRGGRRRSRADLLRAGGRFVRKRSKCSWTK